MAVTRDDPNARSARIDMILEELRLNTEDLKVLAEQARERARQMRNATRIARNAARGRVRKKR